MNPIRQRLWTLDYRCKLDTGIGCSGVYAMDASRCAEGNVDSSAIMIIVR